MLLYDHKKIEAKWQNYWAKNGTFHAQNHSDKPKFYALDMFPYPSGAGLHVGHPLGYIASDIVSRYKRHTGFNVLHPMGYDSFGLPAEQYAIQTGQHPAETTRTNIEGGIDKSGIEIAGYRNQMDRIGFSFDWDREVRTSSPDYYKYTQEIFILLFDSWYDNIANKARTISELEFCFRESGTTSINAATDEDLPQFTAAQWNAFTEQEQQEILLDYRLTFLANTEVNWCPALGTVLANDEIVNGVSERGGHPVVRKKMRQWMMRISAFAERLLNDLEGLDWSESIKEIQRNWIGKSIGSLVKFKIENSGFAVDLTPNPSPVERGTLRDEQAHGSFPNSETLKNNESLSSEGNEIVEDDQTPSTLERAGVRLELEIDVFTTRPDTIYGVTFMTLAPEHELVDIITTAAQKKAVEDYKKATSARSERERMADVKTISGVFTGAYAIHPLSGEKIPVWIGDYVLAGYGTGAVMAVPCGDERDHAFANHFAGQNGMPEIRNIFKDVDVTEEAYAAKDDTKLTNSDFLNGMSYKSGAMAAAIQKLEEVGAGKGKTNYRLRDAVFSRQRYWGEPFPVYYKDGLPQMIDRKHLPIELPEVDEYLPTEDGAPPLGRAKKWHWDAVNNRVVADPNHLTPTLSSGEGASQLPEAFDGDRAAHSDRSNVFNLAKPELQTKHTELAKQNRKNATKSENLLWQELRNRKIHGAKFRRQYPIDQFIVDFVCLDIKLIVEVDGDVHEEREQEDHDRTNLLEQKKGFKVIRFTNDEVINNISEVLRTISTNLNQRSGLKDLQEKNSLSAGEGWGEVLENEIYPLELNTMPGWAGSSWYMFRYMDANNENEMFSSEAQEYWENVDLYIGGSEHATGHLLYSRFWVKLLHDLGKVTVNEPFKKMINQGMILGESAFVVKTKEFDCFNVVEDLSNSERCILKLLNSQDSKISANYFIHEIGFFIPVIDNVIDKNKSEFTNAQRLIAKALKLDYQKDKVYLPSENGMLDLRVSIDLVRSGDILDIISYKQSSFYNKGEEFLLNESGSILCAREVEKMSKSKYNVVNPDDICDQYGADTLRLYEMFLGPLEQAKPWNTAGITGVYGFMKKLWKLYHDDNGFNVDDSNPFSESMKTLHKTIKKTREDIENFSFNTSVSSFMIAVNELTAQKCNNRKVLEPLAILISPYAPHIAEELWSLLGHKESISTAEFPVFEEKYLVESSKTYPISFNGKMKFTLDLPVAISKDDLEKMVLENEKVQEQLDGKVIRKTIIVPGKIVNFVVG
jgi:leucyl-tRNA synthetase